MPKRSRVAERYLLAPGEWLPGKDRVQVVTFLGEGSFAAAYKAANEHGEVCFIKEYFPPTRPSEATELAAVYAKERDVVRRIGNHELIPRYWDAFEHEGYRYLVTDFVPGPDLEWVIQSGQKLRQETVVQWCVCLCHQLAFLHSRNVIHHDLKPANVRLNEAGDPVLVDYSAAHWFRQSGEVNEQIYGSDSFLAPEHAERSGEDLAAGMKMDVFAMGRILVELVTGQRLSQDDINRRQDQLYGSILHSGSLDPSFARAVFRSVAYDPQRRYASATELLEEITPAAQPVGRVRPGVLDFGRVFGTDATELSLQCYNAGGGTLTGQVTVDADWLDVGATGAMLGKVADFSRNRQSIRVVAHPDRIPVGQTGTGRIVLTFPGSTTEVPVRLQRGTDLAAIQVQPGNIRLYAPPGGFGQARLTFINQGGGPARVAIRAPATLALGVQPEEFVLAPNSRAEVTVSADASTLSEAPIEAALEWSVEGNARPPIPVQAAVRAERGLLGALAGRLRKR